MRSLKPRLPNLPFPRRRRLRFMASQVPPPRGPAAGPEDVSALQLRGTRILLVEDDVFVAFELRMSLQERGADVVGPACTVAEALELMTRGVDLAILDVNLNGEHVFPVTAELQRRGVPFLFVTAHADHDALFPYSVRHVPRLSKPVVPALLFRALGRLKSA